MEAKTNYTMVGVAVLLLAVGLLVAALWLSVGFDKKKYSIYAVYIHEAVAGLNEESLVKYNGVPVGSVYKIELSKSDPQEVKILLNIVEGTPVTTSTYATLISQGITGNTYIGLSADSSDLTPLHKLPTETYPIIPTKPSLLTQLDKVLKDVSTNVNNVSVRLNEIFDDKSINNFKKTLTNVQTFTSVIANEQTHIASGLKSADIMLNNLAKASQDLPAIVQDLKTNMNKLVKGINSASSSVTTTMASGKITIDQISQQAVPSAVTLLRHLNKIAVNLEKVSTQMRQNPAVIIRGTTVSPNGPGEN